jgi:hypothetical protein
MASLFLSLTQLAASRQVWPSASEMPITLLMVWLFEPTRRASGNKPLMYSSEISFIKPCPYVGFLTTEATDRLQILSY